METSEVSFSLISFFNFPFNVIDCVVGYQRMSTSSVLYCFESPPGQVQLPFDKFNTSSTNCYSDSNVSVDISLPPSFFDKPRKRLPPELIFKLSLKLSILVVQ